MGAVVGRGVRLGVRIGAALGSLFGAAFFVGAMMWLPTDPHEAFTGLARGAVVAAGSLAVGVLLGAATGAALAAAPERVASRAPLRGLLAGGVAGILCVGEFAIVAMATDGGYAPMLLALVLAPVTGLVAAAHSGDILGRTHHHPWLTAGRRPGRNARFTRTP
ncbi:hypothetical protein [Streptomyces sp. NPDC057682]|uniref:hypothetical protein n=1 Tax=Streptomyces sp. NPDC057682 TaxID=3346210 RepID=UPI0036AAFA74